MNRPDINDRIIYVGCSVAVVFMVIMALGGWL